MRISILRRLRLQDVALALLIAVPMAVNAIALLPEVTVPVATTNDDAQHLLFIRRASEALASGENPVDFWVPQMDEGFPEFLYYQNLPHLAVVALNRLVFGLVDVATLFHVVRYLLLVLFPLVVFWSLRRMDFSRPGAAFAAAASSLLSTNFLYGLDYASYEWRGFGLYTQLWAMHLTFVALAALWRLVRHGTGFRWAVAALVALGLAHLLYAYMLVVSATVLFVVAVPGKSIGDRLPRMAGAGALALAGTAWMWLPYLLEKQYLNVSPYLQPEKLASYGAETVIGWLVTGALTDYGRPPVLLLLLAAGVAATAWLRTRRAILGLALFVVWLALYFGPASLGPIADILPLKETLLFHRFIGAVHVGVIILFAVAGEGAWRLLRAETSRVGLAVTTIALAGLLAPAILERKAFADLNTTWMVQTRDNIERDDELRGILAELAGRPGRVFAGLRTTWGDRLGFGLPFRSVRVYQYLLDRQFRTVAPPFGGATLNSDVQFDFNENDPGHYDLFDVRWVIAPRDQPMPNILRLSRATSRYALYSAPSGGHASYVAISSRVAVANVATLLANNRAFMAGPGPSTRQYLRYDYPTPAGPTAPGVPGCEGGGRVLSERLLPARMEFVVSCATASPFAIKETYHPNWDVRVDGSRVETFMVSPSFIGIMLPAGEHTVTAEYRSTPLKGWLLAFAALLMLALAAWPASLRRIRAGWVPSS